MGTWQGTARRCSPSLLSALLIASGTRVLQKNSSWKESTSPGLPVGWEGGKSWAWCRQEAVEGRGELQGRGWWPGGLLGGGLGGMGREASCPWQGRSWKPSQGSQGGDGGCWVLKGVLLEQELSPQGVSAL